MSTSPRHLSHIAPALRALAVEVITLNPMPNNARKHHLAADIPVLAESLRRFGQQKAIVGKRTFDGVPDAILAGNGTLLAAQSLGWEWIAVSWFEGSDEDAQEYALLDNRTAELSEWDIEELRKQMQQVKGRGGEVEKLGWTAEDVTKLLTPETAPVQVEQKFRAVTFTLEQWQVVQTAWTKVRTSENDPEMTVTRAVELILADYNAGN
jgi:ParB-like chromosome segregation protein Spo0J